MTAPVTEPQKETPEAPAPKVPPPPLASVLGANALHSKPVKPGTKAPVNPARKTSTRTDTKPRDKFQRQIDHDAEIVYGQWQSAGKPTAFADCPRVRYEIPEAAVESLMKCLRRSVGTGGPEAVRGLTLRYRPGLNKETGQPVVEWFVCDKVPRGESEPAS